jgi:NAD(P)-dependent dehydrogenase (short-subunit alcohol dehydrogenase family)
MTPWTAANIPDQTGKIAVVTGATSGIGLVAAEELAAHGAEVIMAVRDTARGEALAANIIGKHPGADIRVSALDLASLASIRAFAARAEALPRIDILLNNAGLGMQPLRDTTVDGFERQFGTNHLGHFALTGLLLPVLLRAPAPRVVTIASIAHNRGKMNWDDVQYVTGYTGRAAYGQSIPACLPPGSSRPPKSPAFSKRSGNSPFRCWVRPPKKARCLACTPPPCRTR